MSRSYPQGNSHDSEFIPVPVIPLCSSENSTIFFRQLIYENKIFVSIDVSYELS